MLAGLAVLEQYSPEALRAMRTRILGLNTG